MTSTGNVSDIPQLRRLTVLPSSFDCFLCSVTRDTRRDVGERSGAGVIVLEGSGEEAGV
jgi:hypothetical protein